MLLEVKVVMDQNVLGSQVAISAIIVWIIQRLKAAKWIPQMSQRTDAINRGASAVCALLAAAGITWSFSVSTGTLTVTGLTISNVLQIVWTAVQQFVFQEVVYRSSVKSVNANDSK